MKVCLHSSKEVQNPLQLDDFLLTKKWKKICGRMEKIRESSSQVMKNFLQFDEKVEKVKNGGSRKKNRESCLHSTCHRPSMIFFKNGFHTKIVGTPSNIPGW